VVIYGSCYATVQPSLQWDCNLWFAVDGVVLAGQRDKWWWEVGVVTVLMVVVV